VGAVEGLEEAIGRNDWLEGRTLRMLQKMMERKKNIVRREIE